MSAAGFIATSVSGSSPGVKIWCLENEIWKLEDAGQRTGGRADLGGEIGQRREVVAEDRGGVGEAIAGQLHAVAGVAREADRDAIPFLNRRADAARTVRLR